jgi:hypothetical protein
MAFSNPLSDQRFRSFAERFMIERASTFRPDKIDVDTWRCIMDAKRAYKQIEAVGRTIEDDSKYPGAQI